jgi:hypothetical protein
MVRLTGAMNRMRFTIVVDEGAGFVYHLTRPAAEDCLEIGFRSESCLKEGSIIISETMVPDLICLTEDHPFSRLRSDRERTCYPQKHRRFRLV